MNEVPSGQQEWQMPVKELQIGQWFQPFEGLVKLPDSAKELTELASSETEDLNILERLIEFKNIPGAIVLWADSTSIDLGATETPLGKAKYTLIFEDNHRMFEELPLRLELNFTVTSIEDFQELRECVMEFDLGGKKYYLRCDGHENAGVVEESTKTREKVSIFDSILESDSETVSKTSVLLPYDPQKIASIQARIVKE